MLKFLKTSDIERLQKATGRSTLYTLMALCLYIVIDVILGHSIPSVRIDVVCTSAQKAGLQFITRLVFIMAGKLVFSWQRQIFTLKCWSRMQR